MINGILPVYKEKGFTSFDVVAKLRGILHQKKIGHTGTLDPDATGLLPICLGQATKLVDIMTDSKKEYVASMLLGIRTDTLDISGKLLKEDLSRVSMDDVKEALFEYIGESMQIPPMYSAVKINGKKLYEYARAGEEVERPQRQVKITEFVRTSPIELENGTARFTFRVACSKGTYVRTLSVDLGVKLGFASHMSALRRTASAGLTLDSSLTLSQISEMVEAGDQSFLLPIEFGVQDLPAVQVTEDDAKEISFGRFISINSQEPLVAAFLGDKVLAIMEKRGQVYKPRKVLSQ